MNIDGLYQFTKSQLEESSIPNAHEETSILLEFILDNNRSWIATNGMRKVTDSQLKTLQRSLQKRITGTPIAYIIGHREFYNSTFQVTTDTLIPRQETEILVDIALKEINILNKSVNILEIGTGTGCISISILKELMMMKKEVKIIATDISIKALTVAKDNYTNIIDPKNRNQNAMIEFIHADIVPTTASFQQKIFDLIISNPPYIPTKQLETLQQEVQYEPRLALDGGEDGMNILREILEKTKGSTHHYTQYLFEIDTEYSKEFNNWLNRNGYTSKILKDQYNKNRFIHVTNQP